MATGYVTASRAELSSSAASSGSRSSSCSDSAPSSAGSHRNRQLLRSYHDFAMHVFSNSRAAQEGERLFLSAVREGDYERVENFIKRRNSEVFNIDMKELSSGDTPLIVACRNGYKSITRLLLQSGADVTLRNHDSETAVSAASSTDILEMLLGSVEGGGCSNRHLLHAAWQGNKDVVQQLLKEGNLLDVNCENTDGFTPLLLVTRDITAFEKIQSTLQSYNPVDVVRVLLSHGADPSRGDPEGWTALHHLAACPSPLGHRITLMLVTDPENMLALDERCSAPIHVASKYGQVGAVMTFLENGMDVNMRGEAGATPLHVSAASGQIGVAHSLLDRGADVTLVDDRGNTPMDVAHGKQMKTTLKEAWTEATQGRGSSTPELTPVKPPVRRGHRGHSSSEDISPRGSKPLVSTNRVLHKLEVAHRALLTESAILGDIDDGTFRAGSLASRRNTRNHNRGNSGSTSRAPAPPKTPRGGKEPLRVQRSSSFGGRSSSTKVKGQAVRTAPRHGYRHSDPTHPREKSAIPITVVGLGWDEEAQDIRLCRLSQSTLLPHRRSKTEPEISKQVTVDLVQQTSLQQITDVCSGYLNRGPRPALTSQDSIPSLPAVPPNRPLSGAYRSSYFDAMRGPHIGRLQGGLHGPGPLTQLSKKWQASYRLDDPDQSNGRKPGAIDPGGGYSREPLFRDDDHFQHSSASPLLSTGPHCGAADTFHIEATRVRQLRESSDSGQGSTQSSISRASTSSSLSTPSPLLGEAEGSPSRHQAGSRRSLYLQSFDSECGIHLPSIATEENIKRAEGGQVSDGHSFRLMNNHLRHRSEDAMSVVSVTSNATSKTADICGQRISLSHTLVEESESGATPVQTLEELARDRTGSGLQRSSCVSSELVGACQTDDEKLATAVWKSDWNVHGQEVMIDIEAANSAEMRRLNHPAGRSRSDSTQSQGEYIVINSKTEGVDWVPRLISQQERTSGKGRGDHEKQEACVQVVGQEQQSVVGNSARTSTHTETYPMSAGEADSKTDRTHPEEDLPSSKLAAKKGEELSRRGEKDSPKRKLEQGISRNGSIPLPFASRVKANINGVTKQKMEMKRAGIQNDVKPNSKNLYIPEPSSRSENVCLRRGSRLPKDATGGMMSQRTFSSTQVGVTSDLTSDRSSKDSESVEGVSKEVGLVSAPSPSKVDEVIYEQQIGALRENTGKTLAVLDPTVLTRSENINCSGKNVNSVCTEAPHVPERLMMEMERRDSHNQEQMQVKKSSIPTEMGGSKVKGEGRPEIPKPQDVKSKLNGPPKVSQEIDSPQYGKRVAKNCASVRRSCLDDKTEGAVVREKDQSAVVAESSSAAQQTPVIVDIRESLPKNSNLESDKHREQKLDRRGAVKSKMVNKLPQGKKRLTLNLGQNKAKGSPKSSPAVTKSPKKVKSPSKVQGTNSGKKSNVEGPKSPKKSKKKKKSTTKKPSGGVENWRLVSDSESDKTAFITGQGWEIRTSKNESDDVILHNGGDSRLRHQRVAPINSLGKMDDLARTIANIMSPLEANTPKFLPDTMGTIKEFADTLSSTEENNAKDVFTFSPIESPVSSRKVSLCTPKSSSPRTPGSAFFPEIRTGKDSPLVSSVVQTSKDSGTLANPELPKVFQVSDDCDSTESSHQKNTTDDREGESCGRATPTRGTFHDQIPHGARKAIQEKRGSLKAGGLTTKFGLTKGQRRKLKRLSSVPSELMSSSDEDSSDMESLASSLRRRFLAEIRDTTSDDEGSTDEGNNSSQGGRGQRTSRVDKSVTPQAGKFAYPGADKSDPAEEKRGEECVSASPYSFGMPEKDKIVSTGEVESDESRDKRSKEGSGRMRKRRVAVIRKETTPVQWLAGIDEIEGRRGSSTGQSTQRGRMGEPDRAAGIHEEESSPKERLLHEHVQSISLRNLQEFNSILSSFEGGHIASPLAPMGSSARLSARPSSRESQETSRGVTPTSMNQSIPIPEMSEGFNLAVMEKLGQDSRLSEEQLCSSRGTALSSAASGDRSQSQSTTRSESEGELLHWKKGNVLGKGAFGTVYCGLTSTGQLIAVKQVDQLTREKQAGEQYEKLQEEVELLKTLRHKNIVGFLGVSLDDTVVNIFMQYIPGGSIASLLARFGALEEAVFCRYTNQVIQGTVYLHSNDVIHRDIKGANIMLMSNGIIKLIDFGCAKRLCIQSETENLLRSMKGTPYWMAPEVIMEIGHGAKSDVWSIGCTVIEMATRKPPWADMPPMSAIFAIGSGGTVPQLDGKFSASARDFVNRCLTRNPDDRATSAELLQHPFLSNRKERSKESRRISRISLTNFDEGILFKEQPIRKDSVEKPKRRVFDFE